jgi:hypothetical protein
MEDDVEEELAMQAFAIVFWGTFFKSTSFGVDHPTFAFAEMSYIMITRLIIGITLSLLGS